MTRSLKRPLLTVPACHTILYHLKTVPLGILLHSNPELPFKVRIPMMSLIIITVPWKRVVGG